MHWADILSGILNRRDQILRWGFLWAVCFVFVGLFEEFLFRGYTLLHLNFGTCSFWPASLILSFFFAAVHFQNSGEGLAGVAGVFVVGMLWCFTVRRTGTLWFAVGMHAAYDFGETFLYSVPDSGMVFPGHLSSASLHGPAWLTGGTVGPEASVFDFLIFFLLFFVIHRLYPARKPADQDFAALQRAKSKRIPISLHNFAPAEVFGVELPAWRGAHAQWRRPLSALLQLLSQS